MKKILSKQSLRYLTILEYLYFNHSSTFANLTQICNVNIKTIQEDIKNINHFIQPLHIKKIGLNEYHLIQQKNITSDFIYASILSESLEFSVVEKIFFEEEEYLEDYADSLFISISTLKRIITKINKEIKVYGFQISTNPVQLVGNEEIICRTMINFFKEKYLNETFPFTENEEIIFDNLIDSLIKSSKMTLSLPDLEKFKLIVFTSLIRLQNGHHQNISNIETLKFRYSFSVLKDKSYIATFKQLFNIELNEITLVELAYPMSLDEYIFNFNDLKKYSKNSPQNQEKFKHISVLINDISISLGIQLNQGKQSLIILDIFNSHFWTISKTYLINNFKHNFLTNLSKDSPLVYNFLFNKIKNQIYFNHYSSHEIEEIMYILITHWNDLIFAIQDYYPKFKVGIFMLSDLEHTVFMKNILNQKFNSQFVFTIIDSNSINEAHAKFKPYDLIITNVSNLYPFHEQIISIELYPSTNDFNKILDTYYELCYSSFIK